MSWEGAATAVAAHSPLHPPSPQNGRFPASQITLTNTRLIFVNPSLRYPPLGLNGRRRRPLLIKRQQRPLRCRNRPFLRLIQLKGLHYVILAASTWLPSPYTNVGGAAGRPAPLAAAFPFPLRFTGREGFGIADYGFGISDFGHGVAAVSFRIPHSALRIPHSAFRTPHSKAPPARRSLPQPHKKRKKKA